VAEIERDDGSEGSDSVANDDANDEKIEKIKEDIIE
jgi:hypothetical protein